MDHIIKDAVDKHHPAYNDKAWEKMEKKLDKHLPQKKDRRRFIFFLLLFLLLGGGAFFGITYWGSNTTSVSRETAENKKIEQGQVKNKKEEQPAAQSVTTNAAPAGNSIENPSAKNGAPPAGINIKNLPPENVPDQTTADVVDKTTNVALLKNKNNNNAENTGKNKRSVVKGKGRSNIRITAANPSEEFVKDEKGKPKNNIAKKRKTDDKKNVVITDAEPENMESENTAATLPKQRKDTTTISEQKEESLKAKEDKKENNIKEKEVAVTENKTSPDKKKFKKNVAGNFGITFSTGTDLSFIKLNKLGKATLIYGAGLSYNFKKKITVRAGFYASKKIYTATPEQYYIPPGSYYPGLYQVDAVCKVYEIPVSLSYNFGQRKNHNWFGNAGLSSFLMKSEKYDYQYKTAYGPYTHKTEIKDKNKHYFAVLTLSGGYQYQLNKRISLQAEPYVKLPLAGVGEGKIKLNSAGILFTATIKPIAKKN